MEHKLKCIFENPVSSNTTAKPAAAPTAAKTDSSTNGKNKATGDTSKTAFKVKQTIKFAFFCFYIFQQFFIQNVEKKTKSSCTLIDGKSRPMCALFCFSRELMIPRKN